MNTFFQTLIVGLRLGSIYALVALGYTMVYGIIRLINFAHGDFIMVGGYTMIFTVPVALRLGLPAWVAVLIPSIGPNPKVASQIFKAGGIHIGSVTMEYTTIITLVLSAVVMLILYAFTQKTRLGRAMRCVSEDKAAATLMGINVNSTILLTFGIGSGLAAVAALMYMAQYPKVYTTMGSLLGLKAFVSAVLGGIGIVPGAVLGGIVIGLVESFTTTYISSSMADTFVFLILIVVLIIKPAGIMGKNVGEKV